MTKEHALKILATEPRSPNFPKPFTSMDDDAAEVLSRKKTHVYLPDILYLSDASVEWLSKCTGYLSLDGIKKIGDAAAESLANHQNKLCLNGLETLSDSAAESLAKHRHPIELKGIRKLSDRAAGILAGHEDIEFDELDFSTETPGHAALTKKHMRGWKWENKVNIVRGLDLDKLTEISDAQAESLSGHEGELKLDSLKSLGEKAAEALAECKGELSLNGLETLTDGAAEALSQHDGELHLEGLKTISDKAAASLSKYKGELVLKELTTFDETPGFIALAEKLKSLDYGSFIGKNLESIPVRIIEILGQRPETALALDRIPKLSREAMVALSKIKGSLYLRSFKTLSEEEAAILGKKTYDLVLSGLTDLSPTAASNFVSRKGVLDLSGITHIKDELAMALSRCVGPLQLDGLKELGNTPGHVALAKKLAATRYFYGLPSLETMSDEVAAMFANLYEDRLGLHKISHLSDGAAAALSQYKGHLYLMALVEFKESPGHIALAKQIVKKTYSYGLPSLKILPLSVALILSKAKTSLYLPALENISDDIAKAFAKGKGGKLGLQGLKSLSDVAAAAFSKYDGDLVLSGLETISDTAAAHLSTHKGNLFLSGLTTLSDAAAESLSRYQRFLDLTGLKNASEKSFALLRSKDNILLFEDVVADS